jgi:hypothetical protein
MKISNDTLRMINKLSKKRREKVDAIVRRHVAACQKNGFYPENMERVYIEAIEMVELEERFPNRWLKRHGIGNRRGIMTSMSAQRLHNIF